MHLDYLHARLLILLAAIAVNTFATWDITGHQPMVHLGVINVQMAVQPRQQVRPPLLAVIWKQAHMATKQELLQYQPNAIIQCLRH